MRFFIFLWIFYIFSDFLDFFEFFRFLRIFSDFLQIFLSEQPLTFWHFEIDEFEQVVSPWVIFKLQNCPPDVANLHRSFDWSQTTRHYGRLPADVLQLNFVTWRTRWNDFCIFVNNCQHPPQDLSPLTLFSVWSKKLPKENSVKNQGFIEIRPNLHWM